MLNLEKATDAAVRAFPEKDPEILRSTIERLVRGVRDAEVEQGNFVFHSTYGIYVQKVWYANEETPDAVEVFLLAARDDEDVI